LSSIPLLTIVHESFANANVLLVLGELMGGDNEDGSVKRTAIPLIAGAIVLAQCTMTIATYIGDEMTKRNCGRKPLFLAGLITLPIRCALIILWRDKGEAWLLSTQILDGIGGGFFGLLHPYLVADITFGTGRFNVLSKFIIPSVLCSSILSYKLTRLME
jgi:MFS family permease